MLRFTFGRWWKRYNSPRGRTRSNPWTHCARHALSLEDRLLLASTSQFSNPSQFTAVGSQVFFSADYSNGERRLGVTDGTAGGTKILKAFQANSYLQDFTELNGKLYFVANDGVSGYELWVSDGTSAGTQMVLDINAGSASGCAPEYTSGLVRTAVLNGYLYFGADDGVHGRELWRTDGTAAGTAMVKDVYSGSSDGQSGELLAIGSTLYFGATSSASSGQDLWKTDGTAAGTVLVRDLPSPGGLGNLTNVNGTLFFGSGQSSGPSYIRTLWKSDGTAAGTVNIVGVTMGLGDIQQTIPYGPLLYPYLPRPFAVLNGSVVFSAYTSTDNYELFISDGTTAGTLLLKEINPSAGSYPQDLKTIGSTVYFSAQNPTSGQELWKTDGTAAGTVLVRDLSLGANSSSPQYLTDFKGTLFFGGFGSNAFYKSDGTSAGTSLIRSSVRAVDVTAIGNFMFFSGNVSGANSGELWISDGTSAGTKQLVDLTDLTILGNSLPPTALTLSFSGVAENKPVGSTVGTFATVDPDASDAFTYALVSGTGSTDNGVFQISGNTLQTAAVFDYETKKTYSIRVRTTDLGGNSFDNVLTVSISNVNDPPSVSLTGVVASAPENASTPIAVATIVVTDDALGSETLSLSGADAGSFEIVGNQLRLKSGTLLDYESGKTAYAVTVNVDDATIPGIDGSVDYVLNVTDVNEAPSAAGLTGVVATLPENSSTPIDLATVAITDDLLGTNTIGLSGPDAAAFQIIGTTLRLKSGIALNYEAKTTYSVTVTVDDAALPGVEFSLLYSLAISDVNEFGVSVVSDANVALNAVAENTSSGTPVGIAAFANDADATNNTVTYSLTDDAGGRFAIDSSTGIVTVANGSLLNFEAAASHTITVQAASSDGSTSSQSFVIAVTDVNEFAVGFVTDSNAAPNTVPENSPAGTVVGLTALASDSDGTNNTVTYSLSADASGRFTINRTTGVVTVAPGAVIDRELNPAFGVTVVATSADGSTASAVFTILVTDVNEFPVSAVSDTNAAANSVPENAANGTLVGITAKATDKDYTTNTVTYSLSDNAGGRFAINSATGVVTVANGSLIDRELNAAFGVTVVATSADGSTSSAVFTILVTDVNEFPVSAVSDTNAAANSVPENAANGTLVGITAKATDKDYTTNTVTYSLSNNAGGRFAINAQTGIITVAPGAVIDRELNPAFGVTVVATSQDGSTSSAVFTILVTDVNEFPVSPISDIDNAVNSVTENAANGTLVGITAKATDKDYTTNTVTYSLTDNAGGRFAINATSGVVTVANGVLLDRETAATYPITVKASSQDGSFSLQLFGIALTDVNEFTIGLVTDANAAANSVPENAANGTLVGITASASDKDATNSAITYSLTDNSGGRFAINSATGVVSVANGQLLDFETATTHSITVKAVSQDGSSSTQSFTITVSNVNEGARVILSKSTVPENQPIGTPVGTLSVADTSATGTVYTLVTGTGGTDNQKFKIDGNQLKTAVIFDFETKSSYSIRVQMKGTGGVTLVQVFTISVTNANDAPTALTLSGTSIAENNAIGQTIGTLTGADPDLGDTFTYTLVSGSGSTDNAKFTISGNALKAAAKFDYETKKTYTIRVRVTDASGLSFEKALTITVINGPG